MDKAVDQLVVRQHKRIACRLHAEVAVSEDSPSRVLLSRSVGTGTGVMTATVVDCSAGGVGIECGVYLPRQVRVQVRVRLDDAGGGGGGAGTVLDLEGTVQRAAMISREPRYYLGLAFKGRNTPSPATIDRLLECAARHAAAEGSAA